MTYADKLKDPRWQKRRLEILQRDNWTCRSCKDTTKTLHVHHLDYLPNTEPWDYGSGFLITLCEDCHEDASALKTTFESQLTPIMRLIAFDVVSMSEVIRVLCRLKDPRKIFKLLNQLIKDEDRVIELLTNEVELSCQESEL